jgi:glutamine synthetase
MSDWLSQVPEAARDYVAGRKPDEVECIVPDLAGVARGKAMPASKFAKQAHFYLPNSIFLQTITGDWAESPADAFTEPDMILKPDFRTARAAPWTADVTLQVIHDVFDQRGEPVPTAPRNVLKRVIELYAGRRLDAGVAPEMEFYLVARNTDPNSRSSPPMGRTGRRAAGKQAYSMSAVDEYGPVIDDIYDFAEAQGFEIDGILQEGGAGQVEINLQHGDPVDLADEIFYFKRLIREAALRHDCFATFMAKPIEGEPGSAMHIHHSVLDTATGRNIFSDEKGGETAAFHHFIAGMQNYLPAVIAILAPYVNSYRRYVRTSRRRSTWNGGATTAPPGFACRSPNPRRGGSRTGWRGWTATPISASLPALACGYLGLKEGKTPRTEYLGDAYMGEDELPLNLGDALDLFAASAPMREVLGEEFCTVYEAVKRLEYTEFLQVISPWEREHLLLNV